MQQSIISWQMKYKGTFHDVLNLENIDDSDRLNLELRLWQKVKNPESIHHGQWQCRACGKFEDDDPFDRQASLRHPTSFLALQVLQSPFNAENLSRTLTFYLHRGDSSREKFI